MLRLSHRLFSPGMGFKAGVGLTKPASAEEVVSEMGSEIRKLDRSLYTKGCALANGLFGGVISKAACLDPTYTVGCGVLCGYLYGKLATDARVAAALKSVPMGYAKKSKCFAKTTSILFQMNRSDLVQTAAKMAFMKPLPSSGILNWSKKIMLIFFNASLSHSDHISHLISENIPEDQILTLVNALPLFMPTEKLLDLVWDRPNLLNAIWEKSMKCCSSRRCFFHHAYKTENVEWIAKIMNTGSLKAAEIKEVIDQFPNNVRAFCKYNQILGELETRWVELLKIDWKSLSDRNCAVLLFANSNCDSFEIFENLKMDVSSAYISRFRDAGLTLLVAEVNSAEEIRAKLNVLRSNNNRIQWLLIAGHGTSKSVALSVNEDFGFYDRKLVHCLEGKDAASIASYIEPDAVVVFDSCLTGRKNTQGDCLAVQFAKAGQNFTVIAPDSIAASTFISSINPPVVEIEDLMCDRAQIYLSRDFFPKSPEDRS